MKHTKVLNESELLTIIDLLLYNEKQFTGILAGKTSKTSLAHQGSFVHRMFWDFRNPGIMKALELLVEYTNSSNTEIRGVTRLLEFISVSFNHQARGLARAV